MRIRDWSAYVSSSDLLSGDQVDHRSAPIRLSHHKGETRQPRAPSLSRSRRLARASHFAVHGRLRQGRDYTLLDIAAEGAVARLGEDNMAGRRRSEPFEPLDAVRHATTPRHRSLRHDAHSRP